ncbi:MAG: cobaltochelatase subunit CobN [Schwartzia sp.]|nr:cobaltochelatase subunit CobN [Schwartzia sp. (in: firmicutes)]
MAGSFGEIAELEYMLVAYFHLRVIEPWNLETIKAKVKKQAAVCHFSDNLAEEWEFDAYAAALYRTVCELKHSPIRTGLLDTPLSAGKARVDYFLLLAHEGSGAFGELLRFLASEAGYTPEELCEHPGLMTEDEQTYGQCYDALLDRLRALLKAMDDDGFSQESAMKSAAAEKDCGGLTPLLLSVSEEAMRLSEKASTATRCTWPRRMRLLSDDTVEIQRRFRSEAINPLFIEGMADYGRRGAMALAAYVARSCQWDALCQGLENWMYEALAQTYALRPEVQRWMCKVCPGALRHLTGSLIAAAHSPRWHASLKTRMELLWLYRSLEKPQRVRHERAETEQKQA